MLSGRANQPELCHVSSKSSRSVVIFAVDVIGDCSTKRDELRARSHRQEPSFRNEYLQNSGKAHTALGSQDPRLRIKSDEVRQPRGFNDRVVVVDAAIPVAPSKSEGKYGAVILGKGK